MTFKELFGGVRPVIGVVHLQALPGSPGYGGDLEAVLRAALTDSQRLVSGGCDALIVENFHDAPFHKDRVGPETVAAMTLIAAAVADSVPVPIGLNVLRNDARAGVAIAATVGGRFVRVNVHVGVMLTDQGLIEGRAAETLRFRSTLRSDVAVFADLLVKHATPLGPVDIARAAHDTYFRGLADGLIITGTATGQALDLAEARAVRQALPEAPLLAGSGVTPETVAAVLEVTDGVIVGSTFHQHGDLTAPVDEARVRALIAAAR
jgi:membrane complex biogenesis BtpA family protein